MALIVNLPAEAALWRVQQPEQNGEGPRKATVAEVRSFFAQHIDA